jgi:RNA polymerase sigma factor (sigma-70 family)
MNNDHAGVLDQVSRLIRRQVAGELSDAELLDRYVCARDTVAFEAILRRHGPLVLRVCRRVLGREQDAEDAFQATFLVFSRKAASLRKKESLGAWLYGVASRLAVRARLKARRRATHEAAVAARAAEASTSQPVISEAEAALEEELQRLPEKYRAVLVLAYVQGLTRDEAAQFLGQTPANVKKRLERGRALLQSRLARRGVTLSSALLGMLLATDSATAIPPALIAPTLSGAVAVATKQSLSAAGLPREIGDDPVCGGETDVSGCRGWRSGRGAGRSRARARFVGYSERTTSRGAAKYPDSAGGQRGGAGSSTLNAARFATGAAARRETELHPRP